MFPIPGIEWKPHASDIEANNQPRAYMLVIILDECFKRELLPEVGCRAQIFVSIAQRPHKVKTPNNTLASHLNKPRLEIVERPPKKPHVHRLNRSREPSKRQLP